MIFDLLEKKIEKHDSITTIDIDPNDRLDVHKVIISSPSYREIDGEYYAWKYSTYGYIWSKEVKSSNINYLLFYRNFEKGENKTVYIYKYDRQINTRGMMMIAKCVIYEKNMYDCLR